MRFTKFEINELCYKLQVIIDSEDHMATIGKTEEDFENLIKKVESNSSDYEAWEMKELVEEAKDLLLIAETNYSAGFPEYYPDVRKLRKLNEKLELINA